MAGRTPTSIIRPCLQMGQRVTSFPVRRQSSAFQGSGWVTAGGGCAPSWLRQTATAAARFRLVIRDN